MTTLTEARLDELIGKAHDAQRLREAIATAFRYLDSIDDREVYEGKGAFIAARATLRSVLRIESDAAEAEKPTDAARHAADPLLDLRREVLATMAERDNMAAVIRDACAVLLRSTAAGRTVRFARLPSEKKIAAIKAIRLPTGWDLKAAKDAIEAGIDGRAIECDSPQMAGRVASELTALGATVEIA